MIEKGKRGDNVKKAATKTVLASTLLIGGLGVSQVSALPAYSFTEKSIKPANEKVQSLEIQSSSNKVSEVDSFKFYYGSGSSTIVDQMKRFDMMIVDPLSLNPNYLDEVKNADTVVYGYISAMEVANWNTGLMNQLNENDFFHYNSGSRHHFSQWDSYLMNITSKHYQDVLLDEIEEQVVENGLDGVFLDTVGDVEDYIPAGQRAEHQKAMKEFMQRIHERFPGLSVGQNWGFDTLENYTAPYVDFFVWENFSAPNISGNQWYADRIEQLNQIQSQHGVEVLTISYQDKSGSKSIAEENGFKNSFHPGGTYYNQW